MQAGDYRDLIYGRLDRHRWIICHDVAAGATAAVRAMRDRGAPRPFLLAGSKGTGDLPTDEECEMVILGSGGDTMMGGIRNFHEAVRNLPPEVRKAIESWDPKGTARVLTTFLDTELEIFGRTSWGSRPAAWLALEDKTTADEVWRAADVAHAPSEVVVADRDALLAAASRLAGPEGTVWAGDNREGWHGGAEYTRYVADPAGAEATVEFMAAHCNRVRVMPFLSGLPCSIHGLVFPDTVATFKPIEMLVYRRTGSDQFLYASAATSWDPPAAVRDDLRGVARRVGSHLRAAVGFRGAFTVDGVLTEGGWLPTELNPRYGAGLNALARPADLPLVDLNRLLIAGEHDGIDPKGIESLVLEATEANRHVAGFTIVPGEEHSTEERRAAWDGQTVRPVDEGGNATLMRGPAAAGRLVRFQLDTRAIPVGEPAAPIVREAFRAIDDLWDAGIGGLIPGSL